MSEVVINVLDRGEPYRYQGTQPLWWLKTTFGRSRNYALVSIAEAATDLAKELDSRGNVPQDWRHD